MIKKGQKKLFNFNIDSKKHFFYLPFCSIHPPNHPSTPQKQPFYPTFSPNPLQQPAKKTIFAAPIRHTNKKTVHGNLPISYLQPLPRLPHWRTC